MPAKNTILGSIERLYLENQQLRLQLEDVKRSIEAIRTVGVDAVVVASEKKLKVYVDSTSDKSYRMLIENIHEGAVMLDKHGTVLFSNSCFAKLVGLPLQKTIGTEFATFIEESSRKRFENAMIRSRKNAVRQEVCICKKNGRQIPVLMSVKSLLLDDVSVLSVILTDMTVQNKNQRALQNTTSQLLQKIFELEHVNKELGLQNKETEKRTAELITANYKLAVQNKEKSRQAKELLIANDELNAFNYISSHDLQEPLRKIQTFVTYILEKENNNLSDNGKDYFRRMQMSAARMQQLIRDLLAYAHLNTREVKFQKTPLRVIVEEVKEELKETILGKQAVIDCSGSCVVNIISFQFRQLFINLISNSLKFSRPGIAPSIAINCKIEKGKKTENKKLSGFQVYCHITFTDNGIGFDAKFNERVFGLFQKLHRKEIYEGTGIGLAIVKKIVENHHGIISVSSVPNEGTKFDIYIPHNLK